MELGLILPNVTLGEGMMLSAPPLQVVLLQIFTHLQTLRSESDAIRVHYNSIKEDFHREEDRCRKEQARRTLLENQLIQETSALRLRAQQAQEAALEFQKLLQLAREDILDLKSEANTYKEISEETNDLLMRADEEMHKMETASKEKDQLLKEVMQQHNLTIKEFEDVVEERDRLQNLLELKEELLQKVRDNASITEAHLQVASLQLNYYRNVSEDRSMKLDEARHKASIAEGQLDVAMMQINHYKERSEENHALLERTKQQNFDFNNKLETATEELHQFRNLAEETKKLLEQSDRKYNSCEIVLDRIREEIKELKKVVAERSTLLEISDERVDKSRKELENMKQRLNYFINLANSRETVIEQVQEKANVTEGLLNVAKQQTERFKNFTVNATRDLMSCRLQLNDIRTQVRGYLLPLLPTIEEGLTTEEALVVAARLGNVTEMFILLTSGTHIESCDLYFRQTPLTWAAEKGHLESCKFLIERHADVNARAIGWKNRTPLHAAAINNHLAVVQLLVDNGAEIGPVNSDGNTPADEASEIVREWLLARGG